MDGKREQQPNEFRDAAELKEAVRAFSRADVGRLRKIAASYAFGSGMESSDLVQETIRVCLEPESGRHWRQGVPLMAFLSLTMHSIAFNERKKYRRLVYRDTEIERADEGPTTTTPTEMQESNGAPTTVFDGKASSTPVDARESEENAITRIYLEKVLQRLKLLFADDPHARAVLDGDMEGSSADEIRQKLGIDHKTYASIRRRVRRKISQEFGKDGNR